MMDVDKIVEYMYPSNCQAKRCQIKFDRKFCQSYIKADPLDILARLVCKSTRVRWPNTRHTYVISTSRSLLWVCATLQISKVFTYTHFSSSLIRQKNEIHV